VPTRKRIVAPVKTKKPDFVYGGSVQMGATTTFSGTQETTSEGHPWYSTHRGFQGRDVGGAFSTRRYIWEPQYGEQLFTLLASNGPQFRDGSITSIDPTSSLWTDLYNETPAVSGDTLVSWGSTAVSQVYPTKAPVNLAVSATELLREGLPKMVGQATLKSKLKDFRTAGDEVLNAEFAIKPLIGDIRGTAKSIVGAAERLKQLERDSGKLVRRKFTFPVRSESFITNQSGVSAIPSSDWAYTDLWKDYSRNRRQITKTYTTRRWFSGAFTYYLDLGERQRNQMYAAADNARLLLGVDLTPETLWNLAPWSWLADWFGNIGDVMTNLSAFSRDQLVMPYGYIMAETSVTVDNLLYDLNWWDPNGPKSVRDKAGFIRKQRSPASPFGFGLSDMVLDTRQASILAALGITRVPKK